MAATTPPDDHRATRRVAGLVVIVVLLAALFGWAGAVFAEPAPALNDYPDTEDVGPSPSRYVGDRVAIGGVVLDVDPVVVRLEYGVGATRVLVVTGVERPVEAGDTLQAFGTLRDARTLEADRVLVRDRWRYPYMYGVSLLAGLWVLGRVARDFGVDRSRRAVVPRDHSTPSRDGELDA